jgi:hypothetical protein
MRKHTHTIRCVIAHHTLIIDDALNHSPYKIIDEEEHNKKNTPDQLHPTKEQIPQEKEISDLEIDVY